ncbi:GNAT family N-acetyltransferase [Conexibacter stalactiti]|uniref:GNAT family N-acetyltransferase n=1 Tax=Conexibacter stalactiti TaxID=1940611 RepID=A0ABU4HSS9_9ACTN|nr:GNAT family N-acetyltransferase [Conexibacter stalactiti]MDW5596351.1 GNAT family N-acetyltransferase [Conexibacter stalactiti]MEC5036993.1 GNAT family N-acetyltransferase [Conexibacter stalactiti]
MSGLERAARESGQLDAELLTDDAALDALTAEWDALAVAMRMPLAAPGWVLAEWRNLRAPETVPRVVAVREKGALVGLVPFCTEQPPRGRVDYRLLTGATPEISPLAVPGREWEVAAAAAGVLAEATPRPDAIALEGMPVATQWPTALRLQWPGRVRPVLRQYWVQGRPTVSLAAGSFDAWLASKSSNFRGQMRRMRRDFARAGGISRAATQETLADDVASFLRLHLGRWEGRGSSSLSDVASQQELFVQVGRELLDSGRFRLRVLELDGEPISAQLFGEAGGEVVYCNGGWDERHARLRPAMLGILDALEECFERGDQRLNLGPGEQPYKLRFADGSDPVAWSLLLLPGRRLPLTLARVAPMVASRELRDFAKRVLDDEQSDRLRDLRRRISRASSDA